MYKECRHEIQKRYARVANCGLENSRMMETENLWDFGKGFFEIS